MKLKHNWTWTACGKHPIAGDYFKLDSNSPLFAAFFNWIEKGYQLLSSNSNKTPSTYSWRFWTRGLGEHGLACGIMKDSSDSIGRPYPLLILGHGRFERWEDNWDLLPFAFEETWQQMEYMASRRFTDLTQIEKGLRSIKPPDPNWSEFTDQRESREEFERDFCGMENKVSGLREKTEFYVLLDSGPSNDPFALVDLWHFSLKTRIGEVPNAVFIGGIPEQACLAVFKRPLVPRDFVQLWAIFSKEDLKNGSFVTGKRTN